MVSNWFPVDQAEQMRELQGGHALGLEQDGQAFDEPVEIADLGQHVVGDEQVGASSLGGQLTGRSPGRRSSIRVGTPLSRRPWRR